MSLDFEKYAMKGNAFMNRLGDHLRTSDRKYAARMLRSTLYVLRNHITFEESLHLVSQLPMAIKAVYVDGWRRGDHKRVKDMDQLMVEFLKADGDDYLWEYHTRTEILKAMRAVIQTLREYVSEGEMDEALRTLPRKIVAELEEESV